MGKTDALASSSNDRAHRIHPVASAPVERVACASCLGWRSVAVETPGQPRRASGACGRIAGWFRRAGAFLERGFRAVASGDCFPRSPGSRRARARARVLQHLEEASGALRDGAAGTDAWLGTVTRLAQAALALDRAGHELAPDVLRLDVQPLCVDASEERLVQLLGRLDAALDHLPPEPAGAPPTAALPGLRQALRQARADVKAALYQVVSGQARERVAASLHEFRAALADPRALPGDHREAFVRVLVVAERQDRRLGDLDRTTPATDAAGFSAFDLVREGLRDVDATQLRPLLDPLPIEWLNALRGVLAGRPDADPVAGWSAVGEAIQDRLDQAVRELAAACDQGERLLQAGAAAPDAVLQSLDDQAALVLRLERDCLLCEQPLPAAGVALCERVREQAGRVATDPRILVGRADARQLRRLQRVAGRLRPVEPNTRAIRRRIHELQRAAAAAVDRARTEWLFALLGASVDPAALPGLLHGLARAVADQRTLHATLGRADDEPVAAALDGLAATPVAAARALAVLEAPEVAPFLDEAVLRRAATLAEMDGGDRVVGLAGELLAGLKRRLAQAAGREPRPRLAFQAPSLAPQAALEQAFGAAMRPREAAARVSFGEFDGAVVAMMTSLLEAPLTGNEVRTAEVDGVVMPDQFMRDGRRAAPHGQGVQFYLPGGEPLVDLRHDGAPLTDDEKHHRVRDGFNRLVDLYDGNAARARAAAAFAHQGIVGALLTALGLVDPARNPFSANGVRGVPQHSAGMPDASMTLAITFKRLPDGRPAIAADYFLRGGRLHGMDTGMPTGHGVALDAERSRIHVHLEVELLETERTGASLAADRSMIEGGHLRLLAPPSYGIVLVPSSFQNWFPEPKRMSDMRPYPHHPDAVDGRETPDQEVWRRSVNQLRREGSQTQFLTQVLVAADADAGRHGAKPPMTRALFAVWEFRAEPNFQKLEEAIDQIDELAQAVVADLGADWLPALRQDLARQQRALRDAFEQSGLLGSLRDAMQRIRDQHEEWFQQFLQTVPPADRQAPQGSPDADDARAESALRVAFAKRLQEFDAQGVRFLALLQDFQRRPTIALAHQLLSHRAAFTIEVPGAVKRALEECTHAGMDREVLAPFEQWLEHATADMLPFLAATGRGQSFQL